jgi:hypothetical protein
MSLSDGDIADLAREAVDHRDPRLDIEIAPADQLDPYRRGASAWTVTAGGRTSYISASMTWSDALAKLINDLAS